MSSLIAHRAQSTGSSLLLLHRSGGPPHFQSLPGWCTGVSFQDFPWCVRIITADLYSPEYRNVNFAWFNIYLMWVIRIIFTEMEPFQSTPTKVSNCAPCWTQQHPALILCSQNIYNSLHSSAILSPLSLCIRQNGHLPLNISVFICLI